MDIKNGELVLKLFRGIKKLLKMVFLVFMESFIPKIPDLLIPKDKKLCIFGSFLGEFFEDNSWYLFDYVCKNRNDLKPVWVTKNKALVERIKSEYGEEKVVYAYSLKGLLNILLASIVYVSYTIVNDIPLSFLISRKKVVINLWHSVMIKGLFLTNTMWTDSFRKYYLKKIEPRYDAFITSSKQEQLTLAASFGAFTNKMPITGYPRNDYLEKYNNGEMKGKKIIDFLEEDIGDVDNIILYAPTKREDQLPKIFPFDDFDLKKLTDFLDENKCLLVLRAHKGNVIISTYTDPVDFKEFLGHSRVLVLNADIVPNVTDILWNVDILITDYSGIYFDYLLLDRPMMFIPYDIEDYKKNPGLIMDYDLMTPGPKVNTFIQFLDGLKAYCEDPKKDEEQRQYIKKLFHEVDGKGSCERVLQYGEEKQKDKKFNKVIKGFFYELRMKFKRV
ncbi:MAG: CDP-glycerol glycerophosphotransferase family protein [Candidatus Omnitrophica bacterium]|nr:CDP-glycerol glycerophosphotransferase family protein [Candidatus Omnitrophota bacterium]MBU1997539.1 CDP-glycerol glycerophosphotransferase family protein [Candidatus Omnitrophota bacterium]